MVLNNKNWAKVTQTFDQSNEKTWIQRGTAKR